MWLAQQYEFVRDARGVLLSYCGTISPQHLLTGLDTFAGRSIMYLLGHVAGTYQRWLEEPTRGTKPRPFDEREIATLDEMRNAFLHVDDVVKDFLDKFQNTMMMPVRVNTPNNGHTSIEPFKLITHVMTHEFHHKGQVLSMSRQLGYTPIDTDVIRTL